MYNIPSLWIRKMLISFYVRNYKSILDEEFKFEFAEGKAPNGYKEGDYFTFLSNKKVRVVPAFAILGANGSGKSNILNAFDTLRGVIRDGIEGKYRPNKLNQKYSSTVFSVRLAVKDDIYIYTVDYDFYKINKETLIRNNKLVFEVTRDDIKSETLNHDQKEKLNTLFNESCSLKLDNEIAFRKTMLQMTHRWLTGAIPAATAVYNAINGANVIKDNSLLAFISIGVLNGIYSNKTEAFNHIVEFLKKMDINVVDAEPQIKECNGSNEKEIINYLDEILFFHNGFAGEKIGLRFNEESKGTQVLFGMLGVIILALQEGRSLLVDELENSLHPCILREIVKLFKDKSINTKNAQLIYSTHDTSVLDDELLRISEAGFVRNSLENGTELFRISDFEDVSNADNFRKMYINGQFGGVPFPRV